MKTTYLILLGFAILAVSLAQKGNKKAGDSDSTSEKPETDSSAATKGDQTSEKQTDGSGNDKKSSKGKQSAAKGNDNADAIGSKPKKGSKSTPAVTSKPKKGSKSAPAEKPEKAAEAESDDDNISVDADDILNDEDEEIDDDGDELIPSPDDLTSESDPVKLAEKIRSVADKEKRRELIEELKSLKDDNKNILPGKFYAAAYAALDPKNAKKAAAYWENNLDRALAKAKNDMKKAMAKTKGGIGNAVGDARKIIQADPVGIALRKGEAVFLNALSDAAKNWGIIAGLGHSAVINASQFVRAATFPVDSIPILGDIKNSFHDLVEEQAGRGQKLSEVFANDASQALGSAADDADRQANKREQLLRKQFSSKRNLL